MSKLEHPGWAIRFESNENDGCDWLTTAHGITMSYASCAFTFGSRKEAEEALLDVAKESDWWKEKVKSAEIIEAWQVLCENQHNELVHLRRIVGVKKNGSERAAIAYMRDQAEEISQYLDSLLYGEKTK